MSETVVANVPANASFRDTLLATKLYIPSARPAQGVVPRPRLMDRLNRRPTSRPVLPYPPAGFDQTALLSRWIVARQAIAPRPSETDQELIRLRKDWAGSL